MQRQRLLLPLPPTVDGPDSLRRRPRKRSRWRRISIVDDTLETGAWVCEGLFLHTNAKVEVSPQADEAANASGQIINSLLAKYPSFTEQFQIFPLSTGEYRVTLQLISLQLARVYSSVVSASAPVRESGEPKNKTEAARAAPAADPAARRIPAVVTPELRAVLQNADQFYQAGNCQAALPLYRQAAEAGVPHAQVRLGVYYDFGCAVKRDCQEALRWYHSADDGGDPEAPFFIGKFYNLGSCVQKNKGEALRWLRKGADRGDPVAMNAMAVVYSNGDIIQKETPLATQWYERAAALGNRDAMLNLGLLEYIGAHGHVDYAKASEWFSKSAALGQPTAAYEMGILYERGHGVPRNLDAALEWYTKAAKLGDDNAGEMLKLFARVGYSRTSAAVLADDSGSSSPRAVFNLNGIWATFLAGDYVNEVIRVEEVSGRMVASKVHVNGSPTGMKYFRGSFDPVSRTGRIEVAHYRGVLDVLTAQQAAIAHREAEPASWTDAQISIDDPDHFHIADQRPFERVSLPPTDDVECDPSNRNHVGGKLALARGLGTLSNENYAVASCWFAVGAAQGNASSMSNLGAMLRKGLGLPKDPAVAVTWLSRGGEAGDYFGAIAAAEMYERAEGIPAEPEKGKAYRAKAQAIKNKLENEKMREAQEQLEIRALTAVAYIGAQALFAEVTRDPRCDIVPPGNSNAAQRLYQMEIEQREHLIEEGQLDCTVKQFDYGPLLPK